MRRLAFQVYLTVVGVLLIFAVLVSVVWVIHPAETWQRHLTDALGATVAELLPAPDRPLEELEARVEGLAARLGVDIGVYDAEGRPLAAAGESITALGPRRHERDWILHRGRDVSLTLDLPDGRVFVARRRHPAGQGALAFLVSLSLLAVAVAIGAWPLVRRLTRRLERLRRRVEDLGGGDLKARALVEGRDEVADLARSFNRAADRIERLVEARVERAEPSGARLLVLDRGPGVPEDERERIFEPFHRSSDRAETGQGFGLGLALVRQIARAHGGEARCRPREGGGTIFEVVLGAGDE